MAAGTRPSKAQQETDVGEGLAVGCLALGVSGVTTSKMAVEFAFRKAWRSWPQAARFPVIHAGPARDDIIWIINRSERRQGSFVAAWSDLPAPMYRPYVRGADWTVEEAGDAIAENSGVPFEAWCALARTFIEALHEDEVERADTA